MTARLRTRQITGTAMMSALVVVFDYALKFAGVKIPFPLFPSMKFDLDGIPIVLALLLYGPYSASATCFVAFAAILARSGVALSAGMKALAEFGTIVGLVPFHSGNPGGLRRIAIVSSVSSRVLFMVAATLAVWPLLFSSADAALAFTPFLAGFNVAAGAVSISGGYLVHKALMRRVPSLLPSKRTQAE